MPSGVPAKSDEVNDTAPDPDYRSAVCAFDSGLLDFEELGFLLAAGDWRLLQANRTFCRWVGYDRQELLREGAGAVMHPDDLSRLRRLGSAGAGTVRIMCGDGRTRRCRLSAVQVRGQGAGPSCTLELVQEVTAGGNGGQAPALKEALKRSRRRLRALRAHREKALEEERARIARELHDELGQLLTSMRLDLSWLKGKLPDSLPRLREKLAAMERVVDRAGDSLGRAITQLRPPLLDDLGLAAALEWQVREFQQRTGIACRLTVDPEQIQVAEESALTAFRIFQEALTNVARHSGADRVEAHLSERDGRLTLCVEDNGRGFRMKEIEAAPLGLTGIRERARLLGGRARVESAPGAGTRVVVTIPAQRQG